jgi:DNA adenine methylase
MKVTTDIKRPALRYYGGKWRLAPWIISYFPDHKIYVEPCGGAASVLLQKPRVPLETYNDLDSHVVNFFRVLRDTPEELLYKIRYTPWARNEFEMARQPHDNSIELARRFFNHCWMSMNGTANTKSGCTWKTVKIDKCYPRRLYFTDLDKIAERFYDVQIENAPAEEIIERYNHPEALIYFDPPYLKSERSHKNEYNVEQDKPFHINAAGLLRQAQGYVVISGYACPLYTELYEAHGWRRVAKEAQTNSGGKRIESLWLSPRTWEVLRKPQQLTLEAT